MISAALSDDALAQSLLRLIRHKPGTLFTFRALIQQLKAHEEQIVRAARLLATWDYRITLRVSSGLTFISAPDHLSALEIEHRLRTTRIGRVIHSFRSVQSTNDLASAQADAGALEGTIVVADQQTKGRGRLGRVWYSPPETGIYLSIILRPPIPTEDAPGLSLMTALALADTLAKYCPDAVQIKWPNDVLLGGKKVAGILTELSADKNKIIHVIVGVGINVNHGVGHFPDELKSTATSVRRHNKRKVNRVELLALFLRKFEGEYQKYRKGRLTSSQRRLRRYSSLLGKEVTVIAANHKTIGVAEDIDARGRLILKVGSQLVPITAGVVTIQK